MSSVVYNLLIYILSSTLDSYIYIYTLYMYIHSPRPLPVFNVACRFLKYVEIKLEGVWI